MLMNLDSINFIPGARESHAQQRAKRMTPRSVVGFGIVTAVGKKTRADEKQTEALESPP